MRNQGVLLSSFLEEWEEGFCGRKEIKEHIFIRGVVNNGVSKEFGY